MSSTWSALEIKIYMGFPGGSSVKEPACQGRLEGRDIGSIPGSGSRRSPGEGHGNPFQYSCLENPMDRGASRVFGVTQSWTRLKRLTTHKDRRFWVPYPCKAEAGYPGVSAHEQKGAERWEACNDYWRCFHKENINTVKNSQDNIRKKGKDVEKDKGEHQEKDGFGSSGLRGGYGSDVGPMKVLDPLLVPVQDENREAAGQDHEHKT